MSDKRRSQRAKQIRRDVRWAKKRTETSGADALEDFVGSALDEHPCRLLTLASYTIDRGKPDALRTIRSGDGDAGRLDRFLTGLIGVRNRATTAVLAVIGELLVDDSELQLRCRQELAQRHDHLPGWIADLPQIDVCRAIRRSHVLGDIDELMIETRLGGGEVLTFVVTIDHNKASWIVDGGITAETIDEFLAPVADFSDLFDVVEAHPADLRVWIENGLRGPTFAAETECWPMCRPLVRWLVSRLPEGGRSRTLDLELAEDVCDRFFATGAAARFTDPDYRELLLKLCETGSGDPLRWGPVRVENAMREPLYGSDISILVALDAPDLLRAFIRFAHAQNGISDELTSRTLAVIDDLLRYSEAG